MSDAITQQKREGTLGEDPIVLSNAIVEYTLRLLGYSTKEIQYTIKKVDELLEENHSVLKKLEDYYNF
jgi:Holliday junction resolvasome RuvABC DNA-binding subunit